MQQLLSVLLMQMLSALNGFQSRLERKDMFVPIEIVQYAKTILLESR